MNQKSGTSKDAADKLVKGIKRKTRKQYSAEEKIRIVLAGLRGEESIATLCRREGISESLYYTWSKEFLEAGKQRLAGGEGEIAADRDHAVLADAALDGQHRVAGDGGQRLQARPSAIGPRTMGECHARPGAESLGI
jgi:transposase